MARAYDKYKAKMTKIADLGHTMAILSWDKEVNLPTGGNRFRSQQLATLSGIAHEEFTSKEMGVLLKRLNEIKSLKPDERKNVSVTTEDYKKATKFSKSFVMKKSMAISKAFLDFIPAKSQEERFIHGIDISRVKYVVKKNGRWIVDYYAKEVIPKFVFCFKKSCGRYVKTELKQIKEPEIFDTIKFMDGLESKILSNKVARNVAHNLQLDKVGYLKKIIQLNKKK